MTTPNRSAARQLTGFHGRVIAVGDPAYDEARRVWNGMINRRPLAIVQATGVDDVRRGIVLARELDLPLAIRGGGHNVVGNATVDDGLVLDLGELRLVEVDPGSRTVRAGGGATLGDIDRATETYALAVPMGVVSKTGIAGLTLGGGMGWLIRKHGLTADNLLAAEVVTSTGDLIQASATENSDLLWGLKGGGGNFGVVTSFTFRAYPLGPRVYGGNLIYQLPHWRSAMLAFRDWTADLDTRMTSIISFLVPPPEFELGDQVALLIGYAWADSDFDAGERVAAPLLAAAPPDVALVEPTHWVEWQSSVDFALPKGVRAYWKNAFLGPLDDALIDVLIDRGSRQTWRGTGVDLHHFGGAYAQVAEDATPFPNRGAPFWLNIYGFWQDAADDSHHTAWVRDLHAAVTPWSRSGAYINAETRDAGPRDARQQALDVYGPAKLERLVALKSRYDPQNLFRLNHNIPPG